MTKKNVLAIIFQPMQFPVHLRGEWRVGNNSSAHIPKLPPPWKHISVLPFHGWWDDGVTQTWVFFLEQAHLDLKTDAHVSDPVAAMLGG